MWPRHKRSPFESIGLPNKVFISHSYKDAEARERLLALLPKGVEPFVFPPIVVPPEQMISDRLLDAICDCDGLIYLQGGASAQSFWVALERDYALRQGKAVFAYDPVTNAPVPDVSSPMALKVFVAYAPADQQAALHIGERLRQRYFDDIGILHPGDDWWATIVDEVSDGFGRVLQAGGYIVVLWSAHALGSRLIGDHMRRADALQPGRILLATLDETLSSSIERPGGSVQLYGDEERSESHRIDDLIVRLYWLIYRNTRQNQLS